VNLRQRVEENSLDAHVTLAWLLPNNLRLFFNFQGILAIPSAVSFWPFFKAFLAYYSASPEIYRLLADCWRLAA
jgi:hypothetical protein